MMLPFSSLLCLEQKTRLMADDVKFLHIKKNIFKPEQIYVSDANTEYLKHLKEN